MIDTDELPKGWKVACLSDPSVALLNPKKSEVKDIPDDTSVTFVPMNAVDDGSGTIARPEVRTLGAVRKGYTYFKEGDVIFAKITPCMENGKCAIARGLRNKIGFGSTEFHVVRAGEKTLPEWLHLILRSQQVRHQAENAMHGAAGQQRVPVDFLEQLEIPLPPLAEQRRLVARIEALTSRLAQARQARQAALAEAEHILAAAISSLLQHRKPKTVPLQSLLSEQPRNGWSPPAIYQTGDGTPVLTLSAVTGFNYDGSKVKMTSAPTKDDAHYWLRRDELLITRSNTPELVGHAAIYDGTPARAICCDLIMKMKVNPAKADIRFVHYCLRSPSARQFITQRAKGASGTMQKIAKQDVQEIPIPEIPLAEQRRIVSRLDALAAKMQELKRLQAETDAELAAFTPALLAKAFRGEL